MGNLISSLISGFTKVLSDLFSAPLDFLAGKSCSSICGSTWDLMCYIENFCVANLLKMLMVLVLFYIVLLFLYLIHKTGICDCIGRSLCRMLWACLESCFSACEYGCSFLCFKMRMLKHMNKTRRRDIEEELFDELSTTNDEEELDFDESMQYYQIPAARSIDMMRRSSSSAFYRSRERRRMHLQRSLWPRNHRLRVGIVSRNNAVYINDMNPAMVKHHHHHHRKHICTVHNIKVTKTSKFVKKGSNYNNRYIVPKQEVVTGDHDEDRKITSKFRMLIAEV